MKKMSNFLNYPNKVIEPEFQLLLRSSVDFQLTKKSTFIIHFNEHDMLHMLCCAVPGTVERNLNTKVITAI